MWLEPLCDPNCNVTVNLFDLTLDMLLKIKEFRDIKQSVEALYHEEMEERMNRENR